MWFFGDWFLAGALNWSRRDGLRGSIVLRDRSVPGGGEVAVFAAFCRKLPLAGLERGSFSMGVFCGVIRGVARGMGRISACGGCGMVVFVGFGGFDGRGN